MINLKQLSVDLAFKVGDPVSDTVETNGTVSRYAYQTDGKLFTAEDRLRHINQGISKLYMFLTNIQREHRPKFVDAISVTNLSLGSNDGSVYLDGQVQLTDGNITNLYFRDIKEIFVKYVHEGSTTTIKANRIDPEIFASVYYGDNSQYKPSFKEKRIYWALMNNVVKFLPASLDLSKSYYNEMMITYLNDIGIFKIDDTNMITQDFYLMTLILSAMEAMIDLNNANKFQLFERELTSLLQLIGQKTQLEEQKDGK